MRLARWFGLLGGVLAWAADLGLVSHFESAPCQAGMRRLQLFGLSGVQVAILATTVVLALVAGAAGLAAWWTSEHAGAQATGSADRTSFVAVGGMYLSGLFIIAILFTGINGLFAAQICLV